MKLATADPQISDLIQREQQRQWSTINLIPSENITSDAVREAVGSVLLHKYSEGNVSKRFYEGNQIIDEVEQLTINRAKELFKLPADWEVNVQALSGSNANLAVLNALLQPGDKILSMSLADGGHLSHGYKASITGKIYQAAHYGVDQSTGYLDYEAIAELAKREKPQLLISGGTAYPREIDYQRMAQIAHSVGALYLADIAHEAGLVAAEVLSSPVGVADVVTMTTHKTLRAARGALILGPKQRVEAINKSILPGLQGGPFNNNIAGICVGLGEALQPAFKLYASKVIENTKKLETSLTVHGFTFSSGGSDKHLLLADMRPLGLRGRDTAKILHKAGITLNMNVIPGEDGTPRDPAGIRLGTPLITTQGMKAEHMPQIADWISRVVKLLQTDSQNVAPARIEAIKQEVAEFMRQFSD